MWPDFLDVADLDFQHVALVFFLHTEVVDVVATGVPGQEHSEQVYGAPVENQGDIVNAELGLQGRHFVLLPAQRHSDSGGPSFGCYRSSGALSGSSCMHAVECPGSSGHLIRRIGENALLAGKESSRDVRISTRSNFGKRQSSWCSTWVARSVTWQRVLS